VVLLAVRLAALRNGRVFSSLDCGLAGDFGEAFEVAVRFEEEQAAFVFFEVDLKVAVC
jgi:hypothetical protein